MKPRRAALNRRTQLARTPLRRGKELRRVAAAKRTVTRQRRQADTGPGEETRTVLWSRAAGCCEVCGNPIRPGVWPGFSRHHRLPRGRGGTNHLSNLLLLCGTGTTGCHGLIETQRALAYHHGWLVHTGEDPASIPVTLHQQSTPMYLTDDGHYAGGCP